MSETMTATDDSVVTMLRARQDALAEHEKELADKLAGVRSDKRKIDGAIRLLTGEPSANGKRRVKIDAREKRPSISDAKVAAVHDVLLKQPDKDWTIPLVVAESGINQASVNLAFKRLRQQGKILLSGQKGNTMIYRLEGHENGN